jgi:hypothetical protein
MPPWTAVSRITHDYMDIGGRVTHGAITEEQLSKLSALTHMDVGNAVNAGAFLLPTNTPRRNRFTLLSHGIAACCECTLYILYLMLERVFSDG